MILLEPAYPDTQRQFVRALHDAGATVLGIGELSTDELGPAIRQQLAYYEHIPSLVDEGRLVDAVRRLQRRVHIDRLEATVATHTMAAARAREACGIPGTSVHTTHLCRDVAAMTQALRDAGVDVCAGGEGLAGGTAGFYDTITVGGIVAVELVAMCDESSGLARPDPVPVERRSTPDHAELRDVGQRVITALGFGTSATHMEWFSDAHRICVSAISASPPEGPAWDRYGAAYDLDVYRAWAHAVVEGRAVGVQTTG